jgi:hypothetical protein
VQALPEIFGRDLEGERSLAGGGRFSLLVAAGSGRRGEAQDPRRPAPPAAAESGAAQACQIAVRAREIVASTI